VSLDLKNMVCSASESRELRRKHFFRLKRKSDTLKREKNGSFMQLSFTHQVSRVRRK